MVISHHPTVSSEAAMFKECCDSGKARIPALQWIRQYDRRDFGPDLAAGLTVAVMLVPQGMAYALLAGLPPVMGLYASTFPLLAYALFGSSRHLAVGPVAMTSLLVFAGLSPLAEPGSQGYIAMALLLAFLVGLIQLILGFLRMGFLVNFFSHAVISGFTSAAAITIWLSQVHHLLGTPSSGGHSAYHLATGIRSSIPGVHGISLAIGLAALAILLLLRHWKPRFPGPIAVVLGGTFLVYIFGWDRLGVKVVGPVPQGLPAFSIPPLSLEGISVLFPSAMTILFISYMESISIAKVIAAKEKYKIDPNQEFTGIGLANLTAAFFSAYPVTGGFSRTALNHQAGARSPMASILTAAFVLLTLLFFTPLFYHLPKAILAAIVMTAVLSLIDIQEARHLFHLKRIDGWTLVFTFAVTLTLGSKEGLLLGVAFSLLVFIWRSAYPHAAELGYLEEEGTFRNLHHFPEAKVFPEVLILRIDASLYFANMGFVEDLLRRRLAEKPDTRWIILDLSAVNDVDAIAIDSLGELMENYAHQGIRFLLTGMKGPIREVMAKADWGKRAEIYSTVIQALKSIGRM
jgi:SulP family sulfate permease